MVESPEENNTMFIYMHKHVYEHKRIEIYIYILRG